jgi:hypothetical protein
MDQLWKDMCSLLKILFKVNKHLLGVMLKPPQHVTLWAIFFNTNIICFYLMEHWTTSHGCLQVNTYHICP